VLEKVCGLRTENHFFIDNNNKNITNGVSVSLCNTPLHVLYCTSCVEGTRVEGWVKCVYRILYIMRFNVRHKLVITKISDTQCAGFGNRADEPVVKNVS